MVHEKGYQGGKTGALPLYTVDDVKAVIPLFDVKPYDEIFHLGNGIKYRFLDAGHILGSGTSNCGFRTVKRKRRSYFPAT